MKTLKLLLILLFLGILTGCGAPALETAKPMVTLENPMDSLYPIETESNINSAYPIDEPKVNGTPAYMLPGFITATPDASVVSIVVSEVRHENEVESIHITNISSEPQDISAFMVYSPKLDLRKILPNNLVLNPGKSFVVYNGADTTNYPEGQRWLDTFILTDVLDEIWLTNNAARIIYYFIYYPSVTP